MFFVVVVGREHVVDPQDSRDNDLVYMNSGYSAYVSVLAAPSLLGSPSCMARRLGALAGVVVVMLRRPAAAAS